MSAETARKVELLRRAQDMAAVEVRRRGLRGMRAQVTETALVDHYFQQLVAEARTDVSGKAPLPDTPAEPEHSIDSTGVLTGNADLDGGPEWRPWPGPTERPPLPIYPQRDWESQ